MSKKTREERLRHGGVIDTADSETAVKKKPDVITKARHKLFGFDPSKSNKYQDVNDSQNKKGITKSMTQTTLEYFFKNSKNNVYANTSQNNNNGKSYIDANKNNNNNNNNNNKNKVNKLQKQNSIGSYPIRIEITDEDDEFSQSTISRNRPATVCVDKLDADRDADALALERPRKKLTFKVPEIIGFNDNKLKNGKDKCGSYSCISKLVLAPPVLPGMPRNSSFNGVLHREPSMEDCDLESQAMRVVRTIGQAFEVCHKLSINAPPENDPLDQDEQDTLTQDLLSDRLSDITSDKPKRDLMSEGASDKMSLPPDDCSFKELDSGCKNLRPSLQLEILPPPPSNNTRKSIFTSAETYAAPHSDVLTSASASSSSVGGTSNLPPIGAALSTHHELQLLREQLEQQQQQTREAMAQLQLVREQLAAEQTARLEAQARTHQLLVHNRELLDHIAALVGHLQGGDKPGQQPTPPHMTMPQLSSTAKVERWFELLEPTMSISRPESGFVSCQDQDAEEDDDEREILEGTRNLLSKLSARKQRKLMGLKLGKVTTF